MTDTTETANGDLPPQRVLSWVESVTKGKVVRTSRHVAGTRVAWILGIERGGVSEDMFLRYDAGRWGDKDGLAQEIAILRGLASSKVPVPLIHGVDSSGEYVLMECVRGTSDYYSLDKDGQEQIAERFFRSLAELHAIDP